MTSVSDHKREANLAGSIWMLAAMAAFAIEDALMKGASESLPVGQILAIFGLGGALVFACMARWHGTPLFSAALVSPPMFWRAFFEIVGRLFYVLAIALTPLSSATAILQATPVVVVAGAALFFGERVGWRRWLAIALGLTGVLVIIRPGGDSFSMLSVLAVLGMLGFAGRDLASRAAPAALSTSVLGLYGFLAVLLAGLLYGAWAAKPFVVPDLPSAAFLTGAILAGVLAYASLMKAMRTGEVSAVTPFRYSRLLFGVSLGVLCFDESLAASTLLGCGLIVISGLFILWWRGPVARTPTGLV